MQLAIIKYNAGNIQSVLFALERIGVNAAVTDDQEHICSADKVIFPGVGEASTAMNYLKERRLDDLILNLKQPVLGICLGMQLMCSYSEENDTKGIGIFEEKVRHFKNNAGNGNRETGNGLKIPQIGWNNIFDLRTNLFKNVRENTYVYFVHGYYASLGEHTIATADYINRYSVALNKNNFYGVQFHPEKSALDGQQVLKNFLAL